MGRCDWCVSYRCLKTASFLNTYRIFSSTAAGGYVLDDARQSEIAVCTDASTKRGAVVATNQT